MALYAHDGGDPKVLHQVIPAMANYFYNMDASNGGSCPYHRINTRTAPHNEYTNSAVLISCAGNKGYPATHQNPATRTFQDDLPLGQRPEWILQVIEHSEEEDHVERLAQRLRDRSITSMNLSSTTSFRPRALRASRNPSCFQCPCQTNESVARTRDAPRFAA